MVKKTNLIVKSNYIIEASYKLSLGEQRVIYVLTAMIKKDDEEFKPYKLTVKEFSQILGTKNKDIYSRVSQYVELLREKDLTIVKENSILKMKWLSSAEYFIDEGYVELEFSPKLKPYLLMLKERFTKLSLDQMVSFSCQYSGRIYELLKQYENIGKRIFSIEDLRVLLGIGIGEYKLYADFKRKIILKAKKEINLYSDLLIDFEETKTGRKVTSIKFYITSNAKAMNKVTIGLASSEVAAAEKLFTSVDIKEVQAIFTKHKITELEASYILEDSNGNLDLIKQCYEYASNKNINNIIGYIRKLVKGFNKPQGNSKTDSFNDYEQRTYNFDYLEKKLLGWE